VVRGTTIPCGGANTSNYTTLVESIRNEYNNRAFETYIIKSKILEILFKSGRYSFIALKAPPFIYVVAIG